MERNRVVIHVVVGMGEVGSAIKAALMDPDPLSGITHEVWPTDPPKWGNPPHYPNRVDALHICFPYENGGFETAVRHYQEKYTPADTIIHSTVPVGTSRGLGATHSPVSGQHPGLDRDMMHYTKFFGGQSYAAALRTSFHFKVCGLRVKTVPNSEGTEAGKLLATLQYGWLIALQKEAKAFCEQVGAPYEVAYEAFNDMYNAGMERVGRELRLPIITDRPGPIGGHCVIANAAMIMDEMFLARELVVLNGKWAEQQAELERPA